MYSNPSIGHSHEARAAVWSVWGSHGTVSHDLNKSSVGGGNSVVVCMVWSATRGWYVDDFLECVLPDNASSMCTLGLMVVVQWRTFHVQPQTHTLLSSVFLSIFVSDRGLAQAP